MIDYQKISDSVSYYQEKGYDRIESPWTVPLSVSNETKPAGSSSYTLTNDMCLVASGEQSFLYLALQGFLPLGKFQTVTPCFRDDSEDFLHKKCFLKNELIDTNYTTAYQEMAQDAFEFFKQYFTTSDGYLCEGCSMDEVRVSKDQIDIVLKTKDGVFELGSYGYRSCNYLDWSYGTGCAEPRLSSLSLQYGFK